MAETLGTRRQTVRQETRTIVVTGGPGGGKTSFLADLLSDPQLRDRVIVLPEAIHAAVRSSVKPADPLFQRWVVNLQKSIEQAAAETFTNQDCVLLTHRGTLDALAFCLSAGWQEKDFWEVTGLQLEAEYRRYHGVLHMVSTAVGASQFYRYRPEEHRPETPQEAALLDNHIARIWDRHPRYIRICNDTLDWSTKSRNAREALLHLIGAPRLGVST